MRRRTPASRSGSRNEPGESLARLARTPRPPYYAAITTVELSSGYDAAEHVRLGTELYAHAREIGGFLGLELFFEGNASVAISYWRSREAIARWRGHSLHLRAKGIAKSSWFGPCITRICRIDDDYGFNGVV
jgi:heme-degrading monooxygenase HmoA